MHWETKTFNGIVAWGTVVYPLVTGILLVVYGRLLRHTFLQLLAVVLLGYWTFYYFFAPPTGPSARLFPDSMQLFRVWRSLAWLSWSAWPSRAWRCGGSRRTGACRVGCEGLPHSRPVRRCRRPAPAFLEEPAANPAKVNRRRLVKQTIPIDGGRRVPATPLASGPALALGLPVSPQSARPSGVWMT